MTTEFDVDAPADIELLGGIEAEPVEEIQATELVTKEAEEESTETEQSAAEEPQSEEPQAEEVPAQKRDAVIPRARFDEVNAKLHAEREEVERLRAELAGKSTTSQQSGAVDFEALEDEFFEAVMEGDKEKAKQVRSTINAEIYARAQAASTTALSTALAERDAKSEFTQAVEQTVSAYPFLNSNSEAAKPEAIAEVVEWRDFYINKGNTPARALILAAQKVAPLYAGKDQQASQDTVADKRKQTALATAARVAANQPPRVDAGVGNRAIPYGDSIVGNQDKWEKASETERMRFLQ